jgi:hypothetical protein
MQTNKVNNYLVFKGIARGVLAALVGSCSFTIGEVIAFIINNGIGNFDDRILWVFLAIFIGGITIAIPFTVIGGIWLAFNLYKGFKKSQPTKRGVFYRGALLGLEIGASIFTMLAILYFRRGDWFAILFQGIIGITLCAIIAGLTALGLMKDISAMSPEN